MKIKELWLTIALLNPGAPLFAATNDPTALLQKALFEEEANHNIPAAIQAYQSLVNNLEDNRKLAATAIFRLGECYRKQGKTNEAALQYERITRDFSDQSTLATLSSQNLAGMGRTPGVPGSQPLAAAAAAAEGQRIELDAQLAQLKQQKGEDLPAALVQMFPNLSLKTSLEQLRETEGNLVVARKEFGDVNPKVNSLLGLQEFLLKHIDSEAKQVMNGLQTRRDTAAQIAKTLQVQVATAPAASALSENARQEQKRLLEEEIKLVEKDVAEKQKMLETGTIGQDEVREKQRELLAVKRQLAALDLATASPGRSEVGPGPVGSWESEEIKRIQVMIKDSPDLINAADPETGQTPLHKAAAKGELEVAKFLLDHGANIEARNSRYADYTPLLHAVSSGRKAMVELLLNRKANIQAADNAGNTPLHVAISQGFSNVVEVLLAHGAGVSAKRHDGATPLHLAAANGSDGLAELLVHHHADVNASAASFKTGRFFPNQDFSGTPLHVAARLGDRGLVELLVTNHADVDARITSGETPLHFAASRGYVPIMEYLLAHKADINAKDNEGATPLAHAIIHNKSDAAKLLIENKADLDFACSPHIGNVAHNDAFPIHLALGADNNEILELLLKNGADPNAHTNQTIVPLAWAINNGRRDWADLLLKYKADPNLIAERFPLLIRAINQGRTEIVQALLEHGADPNQPDPDGHSPLLRAVSVANKEMVKALLDHKADANFRWHGTGDTPLHLAVSSGQRDVVELLLAGGANPNLANNDGKTPLSITKPSVVSSPAPFGAIPQPSFPPPGGVPFRMPRPGVPGTTAPETPAPPNEIRDLLLKHGAVEDLPHFDRIEVRRPSAHYSSTIFRKETNDWNRFTLYELLAVQYQILTTWPLGVQRVISRPYSDFASRSGLDYPDLAHIRIRHPSPDGSSWKERTVDLTTALSSSDCSEDLRLEWGDVVEIPEQDHPLNVPWSGFSDEALATLKKCLTRQVEVIVKGQSKKVTLAPDITVEPGKPTSVTVNASFLIFSVLSNSKLLLASSDLAHIKVKRTNPETTMLQEWTVDCSDPKTPPLWLKDGDVVEVPEKT